MPEKFQRIKYDERIRIEQMRRQKSWKRSKCRSKIIERSIDIRIIKIWIYRIHNKVWFEAIKVHKKKERSNFYSWLFLLK